MKVTSEIGGSRELGKLVIQFGGAQWRLGPDQVYRLVGGDERDRMEARQWISLFRPDAIIRPAPFRVTSVTETREAPSLQRDSRPVVSPSQPRGASQSLR